MNGNFGIFLIISGAASLLSGLGSYWLQSRKRRRQGDSPPAFFSYHFRNFILEEMCKPVRLVKPIQIAIGFTELMGGLVMIFIGSFLVEVDLSNWQQAIQGVFAMILLIGLGASFIHIGIQLLRIKETADHLLGPFGMRIACYCFAGTATGMLLYGAITQMIYPVVGALVCALVAFTLYKSQRV